MPHTDDYDKHDEYHASDDPISHDRGFLPPWITRVVVPIVLFLGTLLALWLFLK